MISVIRSGMTAALSDLDVTSNNIANAGSTGFKRREAALPMSMLIRLRLALAVGLGLVFELQRCALMGRKATSSRPVLFLISR